MKIVFRYIYNYEEALEVTNDGFVKVYQNIESFTTAAAEKAEYQFKGWVRRIMINTAIDLLRKKMFLPEIGGIPDHVFNLKDRCENAEEMLIYKDLVVLMKKLPPLYRLSFNMQVIDGYSHAEIAAALGIALGTSKSHVSRAKTLLQKYLNEPEKLIECRI